MQTISWGRRLSRNYLLNNDGTIGLVDFECVKYLRPEVVRYYAQF